MIKESLEKIGFNEKQIIIYTLIIESGKITAAKIAKRTGINRTTVYSILEQLVDKGFIAEDRAGQAKYFLANGKTELEEIYRREVQKVKNKKEIFQEIIKEIALIPKSTSYSIPKIRFYDEIHLKDALYKQKDKWIQSVIDTGQDSLWGFIDPTWNENFKDWITYYWEKSPDNLSAHFLTNDLGKTENLTEKRKFKVIDAEKHHFTANQVVLGEYVIFVVTSSKPRYMVEIHDAVITHNMREMFKMFWNKI